MPGTYYVLTDNIPSLKIKSDNAWFPFKFWEEKTNPGCFYHFADFWLSTTVTICKTCCLQFYTTN